MRRSIFALSVIIVLIFTAACGNQSGITDLEDERPSAGVEKNSSEKPNAETAQIDNVEPESPDRVNPEIEPLEQENAAAEVDMGHEQTTENLQTEEQTDPDEDGAFNINAWGVDWESYKTFDVSELFNVSRFTFDVITAMSDETDPSYDATSGISYTFTSNDSIMTDTGESHQLKMHIGNPENSDTDVDFYNGDENEIFDRFDDYVKIGMGSTMYDAQFRQKGSHKMFSYKYIGYAKSKYSISGRIYLADEDDSIPLQNSSFPDRKYRQKWIEFLYISPQISQSKDYVVTDKEIKNFDRFFDHVLESLIIEDEER